MTPLTFPFVDHVIHLEGIFHIHRTSTEIEKYYIKYQSELAKMYRQTRHRNVLTVEPRGCVQQQRSSVHGRKSLKHYCNRAYKCGIKTGI